MTLDQFKRDYGKDWYVILNSPVGKALISVLEKNDPASRLALQPASDQTSNAQLYLGQVAGWRDCVATLSESLIVTEEFRDPGEPTYQEEEAQLPPATKPTKRKR